MARIRKDPDQTAMLSTLWKTALYIRLSKEDGNDESYSVKNQRQRLKEFLENLMLQEKMQLRDIYIDDGCTGTDSNRRHFQRMLGDIDTGYVNCVMVKDLSRLSRNDWECKQYLQHLFVVKDVRFISLELPKLDSYKNPDEIYEMGVSIQSMYNENHCRETSVKVRGTFNMKRKKGEFIGAFAPYGYLKDPEDRHKLLVDSEAACIVRDIFHWFVREGMSKNGIVKRLAGMGIPCPTAYKQQNGMKYCNPSISDNHPSWSARSITTILTNQMYLGNMVQGRQKVKSYKVHTRITMPENEWFIVEHTHEPIVDRETFDTAQKLMKRDTRTPPKSRRLYTFSGFLRCADCGKAMVRRTSGHHVYYACKTYTAKGLCTRHSIRDDQLQGIVLKAIQMQIALIDGIEKLIEDIQNAPASHTVYTGPVASVKQRRQELKKIEEIKTELYTDWKNGDITRDEFHQMKKEFEEKERQLKESMEELENEQQDMDQDASTANPYLASFLTYRNIQSLDRGIVAQLIKVIYIHEGRNITIDFNFADTSRSMSNSHYT